MNDFHKSLYETFNPYKRIQIVSKHKIVNI